MLRPDSGITPWRCHPAISARIRRRNRLTPLQLQRHDGYTAPDGHAAADRHPGWRLRRRSCRNDYQLEPLQRPDTAYHPIRAAIITIRGGPGWIAGGPVVSGRDRKWRI